MSRHVSIIILNWRNAVDTIQTVASCKEIAYPSYDIIVVDNDSQDGSEEAIRAAHPDVAIIQSGGNLGYAGGNNVGLRHAVAAGADYAMILNNDTVPSSSALEAMVRVAEGDPQCAVATPLIARYSDPDTVWACGGMLDRFTGEVERICGGERVTAASKRAPFGVDVAEGAAMLIPIDTLGRFGWMDEEYFLYFEETDWCCRIARQGGRIMAVPAALVLHKVSATLGTNSPLIDYYFTRNRLRFLARNLGGLSRIAALLRSVVSSLATILAYTCKHNGGGRRTSRDVRMLALRDALLRRWGRMCDDVAAVCARTARPQGQ